MKAFRAPAYMGICLLLLLFFFIPLPLLSQVQTPRNIAIDANCHGFYEYLPQGYASGTGTYPLMVFIHGVDELGDGNGNLPTVLRNGPPKLISQGSFPVSFTVNGQSFSFIVLSPQFIQWPSSADVDTVIDYALANYRVDPKRIYLTGLSMGGGVTWEYAGNVTMPYGQRLAAILPVCGASYPDYQRSRVISSDNLPVWATHNLNDPTCPVSYTIGYVNNINQPPAPVPPAKMTIFPVSGHDAWTQTYDPAFTDAGLNVYQWMLQFQNGVINPLPVLLQEFTLSLGTGNQVSLRWSTSAEENNHYFSIERSLDGIHFIPLGRVPAADASTGSAYTYVDKDPPEGMDYYRLSQTDLDGKEALLGIRQIRVTAGGTAPLILFPNPVKNTLTIQLNQQQAGSLTLRILGPQGSLIRTLHVEQGDSYWVRQIQVGDLSPGYYTLEITGSAGKWARGFIKQ